MTENSSVTALMGKLIPNQKDPPIGGNDPKWFKRHGNVKARSSNCLLYRMLYVSQFLLVADCAAYLWYHVWYWYKRRWKAVSTKFW